MASFVAEIADLKDLFLTQTRNRLDVTDNSNYTGILKWTIDDVYGERNKALNIVIFSHIFYTKIGGYKLGAKLYLNGDGIGKDTHISLFLIIYKSENDSILSWPLKCKVIFSICNQFNGLDFTDSFYSDPTSLSFQKPVNERNISTGCPKFITIMDVFSNDTKYIKDNKLTITVSVNVI